MPCAQKNPRPSRITLLIVFFCLMAFAIPAPAGETLAQEAALTALRKAYELGNLKDLPKAANLSYVLSAGIELQNVNQATVPGRFEEVRTASGQWRRTFEFPTFKCREVEIGDGHRIWLSSPDVYNSFAVYRIRQVLDFGGNAKPRDGEDLVAAGRKRVQGLPAGCFEAKSDKNYRRTLCVDDSSGALVSMELSSPVKRVIEYSNFFTWQGKLIPRTMREVSKGKPCVVVEIQDLKKQEEVDPALFVPPAGALTWPVCEHFERPKVLAKPDPHFPSAARGRSGNVVVYIVIGMDGKVHNATPYEASNAAFASSSLQQMTLHWLFNPATCNGTPIPVSVFVDVNFYSH